MGDPNLVTTCNFHGQEYLFKMNVLCNNLEILVTDKSSGEEWQCSYDATYIENLTHKTGNFKQFDIFVAMIKSGLLRTSESVSLDLLTFEDLEMLRSRKITKSVGPNNNNRRYLIVTYVVEFDKIRYPLPLEYCGPPDPVILQATIRRLEVELAKTKEELSLRNNNNESRKIYFLQKRYFTFISTKNLEGHIYDSNYSLLDAIYSMGSNKNETVLCLIVSGSEQHGQYIYALVDELTEENVRLQEEVRHLSKLFDKKPKNQVITLQKAVSNLEKCVVSERNSHHELVEKLRSDKIQLARELDKVKYSERCLRAKLNRTSHASRMGLGDHPNKTLLAQKGSCHSLQTMYKRRQSPAFEGCSNVKKELASNRLGPKKSQDFVIGTRYSKSATKHDRSLESSSSSNKYVDPEVHDVPINLRSRTPSPSPRRSKSQTHYHSRCSSVGSVTSSRASSKCSTSRKQKKSDELDYKKLEQKIADLQKILKQNIKRH